jgi:hypothetical protein
MSEQERGPQPRRPRDEPHSPGAAPDAPEAPIEDAPTTSEGSLRPSDDELAATAAAAAPEPPPPVAAGQPLLVFLNEVAGGRKLLEAVRERADRVTYIAVVAPQNAPSHGQIVDRDEAQDAARSRVDVTLAVLDEFGIEAVGEVMDPDSALALDDAVRAHEPGEVLLSCLYETRFGLTRKNLVEWAKSRFECPVTHIPVRIEDDSVRWDVTHTLVVATQTVSSPDLVGRLKERNRERPHRYTFICPRSGELSREEVCRRLASTLAEMYREDIDATGQPMSPDPFEAVRNAIQHYRLDEILISTLAGEQSKWLEEDLVGRVREITDKPVEHVEAGRPPEAVAAAVATGTEPSVISRQSSGEGT